MPALFARPIEQPQGGPLHNPYPHYSFGSKSLPFLMCTPIMPGLERARVHYGQIVYESFLDCLDTNAHTAALIMHLDRGFQGVAMLLRA